MNKLLKDRVVLIRAMMTVVESFRFDYDSDQISVLNNVIDKIRKDENQHFLSISQEAFMQISYARNSEFKYNIEKRIRCPLGRYIMRNFGIEKNELKDYVLNSFVQKVWALTQSAKIEVVELVGNDITKCYDKFSNSGAYSCMTGGNSKYTELYALNKDKVSLLLFDELRALLWKTDQGVMVLDRIYPSGHCKIETFRNWAKNKGYVLRKNPDRLVDDNVVELSDDNIYTVSLIHEDTFPYLDTFCFGSINKNKVILSNDSKIHKHTFHDQDGGYESCNDECINCECNLTEYETYTSSVGENYCEDCYNEIFTCCTDCGFEILINSDFTFLVDDVGYFCRSCFEESYVNCDDCGETVEISDSILGYCESCARERVFMCEKCKEFALVAEQTVINYKCFCKFCVRIEIDKGL